MCLVALFGLCGAADADSFPARIFGQTDGLENQAVTRLAQQANGNLWIGTENGLFRYDGSYFREYDRADGLRDPLVLSLFIDSHSVVWSGNSSGLFWLDGDRFRELLYRGESLCLGQYSMLTEAPGGELIVATPNGIYSALQDGRTREWTTLKYRDRHPGFPELELTGGVMVDFAGKLWLGCNGSVCTYAAATGLAVLQGVPNDEYDTLFQERGGRFWARGVKHILTWNPGDKGVRDLSAAFPPGAIQNNFRPFAEDTFGNILTSTPSGFATWNGSRWTETASTSKGAINGAGGLLSDQEGALWIGTPGTGLLQSLGYGRWANYGAADGLKSPSVYSIATDRSGRTWFGHRNGADTLLPGASRILPSPLANEKDARGGVRQLVADADGGMWAGTYFGYVYHVNAAGHVDLRFSLTGYVQRLRLDRRGMLWIAASDGLYSVVCNARQEHCAPQRFTSPVLPQGFMGGIPKGLSGDMAFDAAGGLWLASDHGLDHVLKGVATHVAIPGALNRFRFIAIAADQTFWLAGHSPGVLHIRVVNDVASVIESFSRPALTSDYIELLDSDTRGRIWIGTDHGVNVIEGGKISRISEEDGLIWNDTDWKAFLADKDGSVWIGTSNGVSHLLDPATVLNRAPFAATIDEARYKEAELKPGASVRWSGATTQMRFSGLTFRNNRSMIYHYRLKGFDSQIITTTMPSVSFQRLPPGLYTLEVTAEDPEHGVFSTTAERQFTLIAPWWRSRTIYTVAGMALAGLIVYLWHWNRGLLAQRKRLQQMVTDRTLELERLARTDELTGLLNRSALMSSLAAEAKFARANQTALCVALIDLDHFKKINDTLGHLAGDEVLRQAASRLQQAVRAADTVGRYGGEEFLIIFRDVRREFGMERCELLRRALCETPIVFEDRLITITGSIGLAWALDVPDVHNESVAQADRAMYVAKTSGRNRVVYAHDVREVASTTLSSGAMTGGQ